MRSSHVLKGVFAGLVLGLSSWGHAADDPFASVKITSEKVADNIYMLRGRGGNIAILIGEDGVFMVDDQYAPLSERILQAIRELTAEPVRFVINTHWHGDHTGGNENFGKAGALIVAHENVRKRMSTEQFLKALNAKVPPSPEGALPVITFTDKTTFYWNGEQVDVQHIARAHTDGDSMVWFKDANVLHMGDTFFNGSYPFIDLSSGGSINGLISAIDGVLDMTDDNTKIIPGHGVVSNKLELKEQRDLLVTLRDRIQKLIDAGKNREEVIAAKPTADYDAKYGQGFMKPDVWTGIVYDGLTAQ